MESVLYSISTSPPPDLRKVTPISKQQHELLSRKVRSQKPFLASRVSPCKPKQPKSSNGLGSTVPRKLPPFTLGQLLRVDLSDHYSRECDTGCVTNMVQFDTQLVFRYLEKKTLPVFSCVVAKP
ncbi:hypothetical protein DUI87_09951 [Hirundo rustica rustica]|uniref:Uncharacterized protein n=1 Tax=Hirundo rustica rustica TaxID=333673 RepID=A0A3M0KH18_HIRRU|nr:hypothetical protein DUI87_09951 [Hirundo rustica rustica]